MTYLTCRKSKSGNLALNYDLLSLRETMESIVSIIQPQVKARKQSFNIFIRKIQEENIYADSVRLNQVLLNLLSNALKFTPEGGEICLSYAAKPMDGQHCQIQLKVRDTGIGMSEAFLERIFVPFEQEYSSMTSSYVGSGLGLSIVNHLVSLMGGTVTVGKQTGTGELFHDFIASSHCSQGSGLRNSCG